MEMLKGMPMKYRLLIVVFLPAIFLIWSIWTDYQAIQKEAKVQTSMIMAQKMFFLADNFEAINGLSKIHLIDKEGGIDRELTDFRGKIEMALNDLKEATENYPADQKAALQAALVPLFAKVDTMRQINSQVDSRTISPKEVDEFYDSAADSTTRVLGVLTDSVSGSTSARALYMLLSLMEQRSYVARIRSLMYEVFYNDAMDQSTYIDFLEMIGMEKAFKRKFFDISMPEEEEIYREIMKGSVIEDAERLQKIAVDNGTAGKFGISAKEWWTKQTAVISALQQVENKLITRNNEKLAALQHEHKVELLIRVLTVLATLLISFLLIYFNLRSLARKLQEEINVLSTSGEEIGKSITVTASGTSETATAVAETTTTVEELKQTAQVATDKAKNVADVSEEALKTLKRSENSIEATIQGMNSIQEGMGLISESIVKLSEHGQMIREIIDTVNDLAEQSHILAVNAAIESAKAGDQGKGFAVVAQEVRSLAEQSKQATVQVRNILNDIQNATSSAVMATDKGSKAVANGLSLSAETNESIRFLSLGINKVAQAASQISLSSQQQLVGVDQLTIAMANIKTASNQQVDNMTQIETGIHGLNAVGQSLKQVIQECKM